MMKHAVRSRAITLVTTGTLSVVAVSVSAIAQMDAAKSSVTATGKQPGVPMDIKFGKLDAAVNYSPVNVTASTARVDIDVTSINVDSKEYNDELEKKGWFDTAKYPKATFMSSVFKPDVGDKVDMVGRLTTRGIMQGVTAPITFKQEDANQVFEGVLPVKRNAFKVGNGERKNTSVVSDDMMIRFRVVIAKR